MKRHLVIMLFLVVLAGMLQAQEMRYANSNPGLREKVGFYKASNLESTRDSVQYAFSLNPISLITSYWDYMIGAYNSIPVRVRQDALGFTHLVYTGQRTATGTRRVFYAVIDEDGSILYNNEVTASQIREGYITVDLDPVTQKPLFVWHVDDDPDAEFEDKFTYDAMLSDIPGLIAEPVTNINNPTVIGTTTDNDFDWPITLVGPSPTPGSRRVYTFATNSVEHCTPANASENVLIAYADFTTANLEEGTNDLNWQYNHIPTLDRWNQDPTAWRRFFQSPIIGSNGNVYLVGYSTGTLSDGTTNLDDSLTVFMNTNYGEGPWQMYRSYPNFAYPAPDTTGFVYCRVSSAGHASACENPDGTISYPIISAVYTADNLSWYPRSQMMQEVIFDPADGSFTLRDVSPSGVYPNNGIPVNPWDMNEDGVQDTDPEGNLIGYQGWPFVYWDETAVDNAMMFHYGNIRLTNVNDQGMKAMIWSESLKAKLYNTYPDSYPEYAPYGGVPELFISVFPVEGLDGPHWSEPIQLNSLVTPEFADMIPEWAYPGDYIEYLGENELGSKLGRMKMMFYDDNSWGAAAIDNPVGQNNGGRVMYTTLDIAWGPGPLVDAVDPSITPEINPVTLNQNYPNPFNPQTNISFSLKQSSAVELQIFNLKGQLVKELLKENKAAGTHKITWDGTDSKGNRVSSGIYTYKLSSGKFSSTRKMILMK